MLVHFVCPPFLFVSTPPPPTSTLFPYTTLFRSDPLAAAAVADRDQQRPRDGDPERRRCWSRSEEHTSELQSPYEVVCRLLPAKKRPIEVSSSARRDSDAGGSPASRDRESFGAGT